MARQATRADVKVGMTVRVTHLGKPIVGVVRAVHDCCFEAHGYTFASDGRWADDRVDILREPALLKDVQPGDVFEIDPALLVIPCMRMEKQPFRCGNVTAFLVEFELASGVKSNLERRGSHGDRPVTLIHEPSPDTRDTERPEAPETAPSVPMVKLDDVKEWLRLGDRFQLAGRVITITDHCGGQIRGRAGDNTWTELISNAAWVRLVSPRWERVEVGRFIPSGTICLDDISERAEQLVTHVDCAGSGIWRLVGGHFGRRGNESGSVEPSTKTEPCPAPEPRRCMWSWCNREEGYGVRMVERDGQTMCGDCAGEIETSVAERPKPEPSRLLRHNAGARYHMGDDVDATGVPSVG